MSDTIDKMQQYVEAGIKAFGEDIKLQVAEAKARLIADGFEDEDFAQWLAEQLVSGALNQIAYENWKGPTHLLEKETKPPS